MKRIAIIGLFDKYEPCYSLNVVLKDQLVCLSEAGYSVRLITLTDFDHSCWNLTQNIEVRSCLESIDLDPYMPGQPLPLEFEDHMQVFYESITGNLHGIDVCITQDLLFHPLFVAHNAAIRKAAEDHTTIRWLHWIHSAPEARSADAQYPYNLRFCDMKRSRFVCLNPQHVPIVARQYEIPETKVGVVQNMRDPRTFFECDPSVCEFIEQHDLLDADIICVYPTRLSPGKQPSRAIQIASRMKARGLSVRLVFCNSWADTESMKTVIEGLRRFAQDWALGDSDVIFASEHRKEWRHCVPHRVVRELLQVSNLFLLPSVAEGCSLALLEAALSKTLLVLNEDDPSIRELVGNNALYFKFGGDRWINSYEPVSLDVSYLDDCAGTIIKELQANKSLGAFARVKKYFNRDWILREQLRPLIEEDFQEN